MRVGILTDPPDLSAYVIEMLSTWGLALCERLRPDSLSNLEPDNIPVIVCPSEDRHKAHSGVPAIIDYVRRGGTAVCFLPSADLACAAGLEPEGQKPGRLQLRVTEHPAAGLAGETLPIVGRAENYAAAAGTKVLAYLFQPGRFTGETVGITMRAVGKGRIVAFAFDLAQCVLVLRQGDPSRAECIPPGDNCARPSHMAAETELDGAGWVPFADLLSRLLVDIILRALPAPMPLLSHLPSTAPAVLLYSGDEDNADVGANNKQLDRVAQVGARMNLYVIPTRTQSSIDDVRRYQASHDLGPHPDLRPLDGQPVTARLAELERQILLFEDRYQIQARSLRNHSTAWAGYLEPIEVMERLGVRMDTNFFSGTYIRDRQSAPYAPFGGALPMRFCRPDGRMLDVLQQHTHLSDDVMFGAASYSFKYSPSQYRVILGRMLDDLVTRLHTPYAVCIHPSNWVRFSRQQGIDLLQQASARSIPVWSFDQWSVFWEARSTWRIESLAWHNGKLSFVLTGERAHDGLYVAVPRCYAGAAIRSITMDGQGVPWQAETRYGQDLALVPLSAGSRREVVAEATYTGWRQPASASRGDRLR
jgi:hypothetical protein